MSTALARRPEVDTSSPTSVRPVPVHIFHFEREIFIPPTAQTLAGFRAWATSNEFPERGRISFIDQEIFIDMSPEKLEAHNKVKVEIGYVLVGVNKKIKRGEFYGDRTLVSNEEANLSTEPDATFVTWAALESGRVRLVEHAGEQGEYKELEGTPDWVLEVVSDSSVAKDTRRLRERYHRAGIPEYWLVDAGGEQIKFQILRQGKAGYEPAPAKAGWQVSRVFSRRFRLTRRRGRMGLWQYTLHVRPVR